MDLSLYVLAVFVVGTLIGMFVPRRLLEYWVFPVSVVAFVLTVLAYMFFPGESGGSSAIGAVVFFFLFAFLFPIWVGHIVRS